jgi:hypothetical protein
MTHRDTAAEAIRFAIETLGKDFTGVVIIDNAEGGNYGEAISRRLSFVRSWIVRTANPDAK